MDGAQSTSISKFQEILAKARAKAAISVSTRETAGEHHPATTSSLQELNGHDKLQALITKHAVEQVVLPAHDPLDAEELVDIINDIASNMGAGEQTSEQEQNNQTVSTQAAKISGVERTVTYNVRQKEFISTALSGKDCILIGAAGTGKTTCQKGLTSELIKYDLLPKLTENTKYLHAGMYGAVIVSFTRKAVNNIRRAVVPELKPNVLTIHKLIEFQPEFFTIQDPKDPTRTVKTMKFSPARNKYNPLPDEIALVVHEESSMEGTDLYSQLEEALPHSHQEIFLGDIQQLPPVFGQAILGFKMLEHPVVELNEIYRQGAGSPIIDLAWKVLSGDAKLFSSKLGTRTDPTTGKKKNYAPALETLSVENDQGSVKFQIWQKTLSDENALNSFCQQMIQWIKTEYYNPAEDIILCPYNKAFGTLEINKKIAQYLGLQRGALVHEVIAGFNKHYLAVGDRVLYDKEDAFIVDIHKNGMYTSAKMPQPSSMELDRWGHLQKPLSEQEILQAQIENADWDLKSVDELLNLVSVEADEERVQASSHVVTIRLALGNQEGEDDIKLDSASEINNLLGGYAITVHKSQGSEYEKVFLALHTSHAKMVSRELLYTAVTRARSFLHIICEPQSFERGVRSQKVIGDTIAEKAEIFKGKVSGTVIQKHHSFTERQVAKRVEAMAAYNATGRSIGVGYERNNRNESRGIEESISSDLEGNTDNSERTERNRQENYASENSNDPSGRATKRVKQETISYSERPLSTIERLKAIVASRSSQK